MWFRDYELILGGDFNLIMDKEFDYMGLNIPARNKFSSSFEYFFRSISFRRYVEKKRIRMKNN